MALRCDELLVPAPGVAPMTAASDAAAIAKATGTAFGDDAIAGVMSKYDTNGDGVFSVTEVRQIVNDVQAQRSLNKQLKKVSFGLAALVVLLIGALIGCSIVGAQVGGNSIKESHVHDPAKAKGGQPVATAQIESFATLWNLPAIDTAVLAYMRDITCYVDLTTKPAVGGVVEASFKLASAYKRSDTQLFLETLAGHTIEIDAAAKTGTITMGGVAYPLSDALPTTAAGRKLEVDTLDNLPEVALVTRRELAVEHAKRRELSFTGALQTSGSFTMMASATFGRRRALEQVDGKRELSFAGALMTSSSFTMMAAAGYS